MSTYINAVVYNAVNSASLIIAYLMLFAALSNSVYLDNASFLPLISSNAFYFHVLSWFIDTVFLFHVLICIMHSAFNLLFFPNSMFSSLWFFTKLQVYVLSGEIALKNNHYYYYYYVTLLIV